MIGFASPVLAAVRGTASVNFQRYFVVATVVANFPKMSHFLRRKPDWDQV
jgi:hypothetical protein